MKTILKLRHWQVFLILFSVYLCDWLLRMIHLGVGWATPLEISVIANLITMTLFFLWILITGLYINNFPDPPFQFRSRFLIIAIALSIIGHAEINLERLSAEGMVFPRWISFVIIPLTLMALIYILYIIPKSIRSIELRREARITELMPFSLLLLLFPLGVWVIQPRFNRILEHMKR